MSIPDHLPEEYPHPKRKNTGAPPPRRPLISGTGCAIAMVMLFLLVVIALGVLIAFGPELFPDFVATRNALGATAAYLDAVQGTVDADRATQDVIRASQAAGQVTLDWRGQVLGATATQLHLNVNATQTADVVAGIQQQTQAAIDFQGTQAALQNSAFAINLTSTQVQIDFQATRAALDQNATARANPLTMPTPAP